LTTRVSSIAHSIHIYTFKPKPKPYPRMTQIKTPSALEDLPDDILGTILLYSDFASALTLSRRTNHKLRHRTESSNLRHVWKAIFQRHNFSPVEEERVQNFLGHCQRRRKLLHNLVRSEGPNHFYNLPDRQFSFYPIAPIHEDEKNVAVDDSHSGMFHEDSFACTSTATNSEIVLLDPYDGSLSVIGDCLDANAETKIQQLLLKSNEPFSYYPGREVLPKEVEFAYAGTESKPIVDPFSNTCIGTLLWTDRIVRRASDKEALCTELTTWTRGTNQAQYSNRRTFYTRGTFRLVDIDAKNLRAFVSFQEEDDPLSLKTSRLSSENQLFVYPLLPHESQTNENDAPEAALTIDCEHPVSAFSVDATGETLIVATTRGTIEIWQVQPSSAQRVKAIRIRPALKASIQSRLTALKNIMSKRSISQNASDRSLNDPCILRRQLERLAPAPIESFYLPKHLPMERCGFVTSQKDGSSLLLWRRSKTSGAYEIVSLINPPLSSKRVPQVKYDGSKLLVFGQDAEGSTVLVYQVATDDAPIDNGLKKDLPSGGVYNLSNPASVCLANQIRHKALGGINDPEDAMHMTFNERFIVMNTRTGNQLAGSSRVSQGLLIIDLEDTK
jgi:hypothetical protein